jgi:hypothetical protein
MLIGWSLILAPVAIVLVMVGRAAGWKCLFIASCIGLSIVAMITAMLVGLSIVLS